MTTTATATRWFTPEQANKTLPLVRVIVADICELQQSVRDCQARVDALMIDRDETVASPYQDELEAMRRSLEDDRRQLKSYVRELSAIGVRLVNDGDLTAAEFPAWINGHEACLCWSSDQDLVDWWRERDEPLSMRHDIADLHFGQGLDSSIPSES